MNIMDKFCLKGRKAIVTGGAQGIGFNYASAVAAAGADVAIADINGEKARETAEQIAGEYHVKAMGIQADVTSPEQVERMCREMAEERWDGSTSRSAMRESLSMYRRKR